MARKTEKTLTRQQIVQEIAKVLAEWASGERAWSAAGVDHSTPYVAKHVVRCELGRLAKRLGIWQEVTNAWEEVEKR